MKQLEDMRSVTAQAAAGNEEKPLDVESIQRNLTDVLEAYKSAEDKTDRNKVLRAVFDHVFIEIVERGRGRIPAKYMLYPAFKKDLTRSGYLVL
ncbi:MAG: hypothetical protein J7559_03085 [Cohnella sp.]|nr:hypothetical protein [Cohnella sp.]